MDSVDGSPFAHFSPIIFSRLVGRTPLLDVSDCLHLPPIVVMSTQRVSFVISRTEVSKDKSPPLFFDDSPAADYLRRFEPPPGDMTLK